MGVEIDKLKDQYEKEMEEIAKLAVQEKSDQKKRLEDLLRQIKDALGKNKEVAVGNSKLMKELESKLNFQQYEQELSSCRLS